MLTLSILIMCSAHLIRAQRWEQFIRIYEKPDSKTLVQSLAVGYLLNFFLPLKFGDLFRAWMAGRKMKNGVGFAAATVALDRYLDIISVGIIFIIIRCLNRGADTPDTIFFYGCLSLIALMGTGLLWYLRKYVKKILKKIASVFNTKIEFAVLKFCFSLISSFKDINKIKKGRLLLVTVEMWSLYLLSYFCFSRFLTSAGSVVETVDIFYLLFEKDSLLSGGIDTIELFLTAGQGLWFAVFLVAPAVFLLLFSFMAGRNGEKAKKKNDYLNLIPHLNDKEKVAFLELYFESEKSSYVKKYLEINRNILIINDFSAGSNATTMLCIDGNRNFFRKYAFGEDGEKLFAQIEWMQRFQTVIPLARITDYDKENDFCYYDMAYDSRAVGLFNYAHSMPKENAWRIIRRVMECLEESLYCRNSRRADEGTVNAYIEEKVTKNIEKIMNAKPFRKLMEYEEIIINGITYKNLPYYLPKLDREQLFEIFQNDTYSEIHGDLTIENIICIRKPEKEDDFYIIDPNTGNLHDSPNLDYAKLLQSLHGGYEFLMVMKNVEVSQNRIDFIFTKSDIYAYLYHRLDSYLTEKFTEETVRSIYYHEIVHWLRLMPYKIEKSGKRALLFYAGMIMVMNDVEHKFGGGFHKG